MRTPYWCYHVFSMILGHQSMISHIDGNMRKEEKGGELVVITMISLAFLPFFSLKKVTPFLCSPPQEDKKRQGGQISRFPGIEPQRQGQCPQQWEGYAYVVVVTVMEWVMGGRQQGTGTVAREGVECNTEPEETTAGISMKKDSSTFLGEFS